MWASPSPYAESESKFIQGRMLVSQLGFLSPQQRANFHQIDQSPAFFRSLKNLDRTPECAPPSPPHTHAHTHHYRTRALFRGVDPCVVLCVVCRRECISVGVLYLGKGQTKKKVWANSAEHVSRSPAYQRFLDASGWTVRPGATLIPHIPTHSLPAHSSPPGLSLQVDVATHPGWVGQLDRTGKTGARTLYYADYNKEVRDWFPAGSPCGTR